jgi:hypothetical protein
MNAGALNNGGGGVQAYVRGHFCQTFLSAVAAWAEAKKDLPDLK